MSRRKMNLGEMGGEKVSDSEFLILWKIPRLTENRRSKKIPEEYASPDLDTVYRSFPKCKLRLRFWSTILFVKFYIIVTEEFLSNHGNASISIYDKHCDQFIDTKILKSRQTELSGFNLRSIFQLDYIFKCKLQLQSSSLPFKIDDLDQKFIPNCSTSRKVEERKEIRKPRSLQNHEDLIQDMTILFREGNMSDVAIRIHNETIPAHKLILSARSSVFQKMLEHDCVESSNNIVTIADCNIDLFKLFMKYLYTGEIECESLDTLMGLYSIADQYDVQGLFTTCSNIIQSRFVSDGIESMADCACQILELSFFHSDEELKDVATEFIVSNFSVVGKKQSWKNLLNNVVLTSEILIEVASTFQGAKE